MKIKKVIGAALMLSLSMGILACVPENKSNAYDENKENPIEIVRQSEDNHPAKILRDNETGVEYIYIYNYTMGNGSSCAICPRLDKNGKPVVSK